MIRDYNATEDPVIRQGQDFEPPKTPLAKAFKGMPYSYKVQSQCILNTCDEKRLFMTDTWCIGLAPGIAKAGNGVFVLENASVLFVLRELDYEVPADGSHFFESVSTWLRTGYHVRQDMGRASDTSRTSHHQVMAWTAGHWRFWLIARLLSVKRTFLDVVAMSMIF